MTNEELVQEIQSGHEVTIHMDILYTQNITLITDFIRPYYARAEKDDLLQEAYFGLVEAVQHYSPEHDTKFMSYAQYWIKQRASRYVQNHSRNVRISCHTQTDYYKYKRAVETYYKLYGQKPSVNDLAELLDWDENKVQYMEQIQLEENPLNCIMSNEGDETELLNLIEDGGSCDGYREVENNLCAALVRGIVKELPDRLRQIIVYKYFVQKTCNEIGKILGITNTRVGQLERTALRQLRGNRIIRSMAEHYETAAPPVKQNYYGRGVKSFREAGISSIEQSVEYKEWLEQYRAKQLQETITPPYLCGWGGVEQDQEAVMQRTHESRA